jgi:protein-S-isoprenylcysteine O-methyltransferase Ste14
MSKTDTPGVIAPPPLIYLGFLFIGWGLAELGARPEAVEAGYSWLAAGFGWLAAGFNLEIEVRRGIALTLIIAGLLLDGMAAGLFRRRGTAVEPWKPSTVLINEGPYRFSRNPIYLGFALMQVGIGLWSDRLAVLLMVIPAIIATNNWVIAREEAYLTRKFGEPYERYLTQVRRWL